MRGSFGPGILFSRPNGRNGVGCRICATPHLLNRDWFSAGMGTAGKTERPSGAGHGRMEGRRNQVDAEQGNAVIGLLLALCFVVAFRSHL